MWGDQGGFYALTQVTTDETLIPTRGTDWGDNGVFRTLHQHSWDPTIQWVVSTWNDTNRRIFKLDQLIHPASNASADVLAQAKFLRAFQMTQVVDMYGQVPRRDVNSGPSDNPTVLDSAGALSLIMEDIDAAIAGLPALATGEETSDDIKDGTNMITKTAAQFLKARVLLNKHVWLGESAAAADMTAVIDLVDDINSQGFDIHEDYFEIFAQTMQIQKLYFHPQWVTGNKDFGMVCTTIKQQQVMVAGAGMVSLPWLSCMIYLKVMTTMLMTLLILNVMSVEVLYLKRVMAIH